MKATLRKKLLALIVLSVLTTAIVITATSIGKALAHGSEQISHVRELLVAERKQQIRGYVDMAVHVVADLPLEQARKTILSMRYGDKGYVSLHTYDNVFLAHPDPALDQKDATNLRDPNGVMITQELTRIARDNGEGYLQYVWKVPGQDRERPKLSFTRSIPKNRWVLTTGIYIDDLDAAVASEQVRIRHEITVSIVEYLLVSAASAAILVFVALRFVKRQITGPIELITETMKAGANDLTVSVKVGSDDELGELARWLNNHIESLHLVIGMVSHVTSGLQTHSSSIASAVNMQSASAAELSSAVAEIASTMEELSSSASQIAQHSHGVVARADQTLADAKQGAAEVHNLSTKISDVSADIQANLAAIVELGRKSKEITKIMAIINDIASKTKLIAFNAALEAASAGESGKRFGVVAVEIRRLADNVVESTGEIEGRIAEILDTVNRLVMSSEKTTTRIVEGKEYAAHTVSMLTNVVDRVEESTDAARQISLSTQQQQIASNQVVIAIKDIQQGVRHSADSIADMNRVTAELSEVASNLASLVSTFRLGHADAEAGE